MKFAVPFGVAFVLASSATVAGRAAEAAWQELRVGGAVLRSKVDPRQLQSIACDLEVAAVAFGDLPAQSASADPILDVIAVGNDRDARELLPRFWERRGPHPLGAYWGGPFGSHLVIRVDAKPDERRRRLLHEYAHYVIHRARHDPPRWLDEGLAELWKHASITNAGVRLGGPVAEHLRTLRSSSWIPLRVLAAMTDIPVDRRESAQFYSESWALAHYAVARAGNFRSILDSGVNPAVPSDDELRRYLEAGIDQDVAAGGAALETSGGCAPVASRGMDELETLVFRARALADGDRPEAARPLVDRVLGVDHDNAQALEVKGLVDFLVNRPHGAAAVFDRLIAAGQGSHLSFYYRAILAGPVPELSDGSGQVPEIDYLRRALRLAPDFAPARERLEELLESSRSGALSTGTSRGKLATAWPE